MRTHMRLLGAFMSMALLCTATLVVFSAGAANATAKPTASAIAATANASKCNGPTINLGMIGGIKVQEQDITPAIQSAQAAAAAVTRSCELGGPVKLIACNDQYMPNPAAQCAREMVSDGVIALVGDESANGDTYLPITTAAGIPEVGGLASSALQLTSPLSFPIDNALVSATSSAYVAKDLGATKVEVVGIDVAAVQTLVALLQGTVKAAGMEYAGTVLVPPTATNFSQYAAQSVATGADAILPIFPTAQNEALIKALAQQGTNFSKVRIIVNGVTTSPTDVTQMGSAANGLYLTSSALPSNDTSNPGIKQYLAELKADHFHNVNIDAVSTTAWADVHIVANLLKGSKSKSAATLVAKLKASGPINFPPVAPFNFSTNAFPGNPILGKMQAFSNQGVVLRVVKGKEVLISNGFVNVFAKFKIK